jgi:DNA-binding SARP family transcriptional activator
MWFEVLGSLRVVGADAEEPMWVSAARLRVVLAVLLWRVGQPVSVDELCELVWDGVLPKDAPGALRALIVRLRRVLGSRAGGLIVTRAPGYLIEVSGNELDATLFEGLCRDTASAVHAGHWAKASRTAADALALWRGQPLADVPCRMLRDRWMPQLDQHRVQALEWHAEAGLRLGQHAQVIPRLRELTMRHPLREHFHAQLMTALARTGRHAEALAAYQGVRTVLVAELGIEPGPELRDLHQRILAGREC